MCRLTGRATLLGREAPPKVYVNLKLEGNNNGNDLGFSRQITA